MLVQKHYSLSIGIRSNFEHQNFVRSKLKIIRMKSFNRTNATQISNEIRRDFLNNISRSSNTNCYAMHRRYSSLVPSLFKWCNSSVSSIIWHNNVLIGECIQYSVFIPFKIPFVSSILFNEAGHYTSTIHPWYSLWTQWTRFIQQNIG